MAPKETLPPHRAFARFLSQSLKDSAPVSRKRFAGWSLAFVALLAGAVLRLAMPGAPPAYSIRQDSAAVRVPAPSRVPTDTTDVNSANSWQLHKLGFSYYHVARILELREAGFVFTSVADMRAVPHIDTALLATIGPALRFGPRSGIPVSTRQTLVRPQWAPFPRTERLPPRMPLFMMDSLALFTAGITPAAWDTFASIANTHILRGSARPDSLARLTPEALAAHLRACGTPRQPFAPYSEPEQPAMSVDVNHADVPALVAIPGIGERAAEAIIEYRDRLGGFVSLDQLGEVWALAKNADGVSCHMVIDTATIRRVNVNSSNDTRMRRHPYFTGELRRAIHLRLRSSRNARITPDQLHEMADSMHLHPLFWHYVSYK